MRPDLLIVDQWIKPNSRVLDLGCGDGALLRHLQETKNVLGYGLEIDHDKILKCIENGINVVEQDLDYGLANFDNESFDVVVMSQALQAVMYPDKVVDEMLRIGKECIITFPNFGHWMCRYYVAIKGQMPKAEHLPFDWYNTPNIHLCSFSDFDNFCASKKIRILTRTAVDKNFNSSFLMTMWPNLFGETAIYRITK